MTRMPSPPWVTFQGELAGLPPDRRLALAERLLLDAEQRVRLLDRVVPSNLAEERARLLAELLAKRPLSPRFKYAPATNLDTLARSLGEAVEVLADSGPLGVLFAGRCEELTLEAALVSAAGRPEFAVLAARRFPAPAGAEAVAVDGLARNWLAEVEAVEEPVERVRADDAAHPHSLINVLRRKIGALRSPIRVELRSDLAPIAAAGDGFVVVRPDAQLTARDAERIALHELVAHVMPRIAARRERVGVFRTGTRGASDEEEGRALLLEQRAGFLEGGRQRELALRHLAALAVRGGATLNDVVVGLCAEGQKPERALDLALRAVRGGGLGREVVYLPSYLRVGAAFAAAPELESYFERGRVSLAALPTLSAHASASSTSTGA